MHEDRDRYITATICAYLLGCVIRAFAAFSHLLFAFTLTVLLLCLLTDTLSLDTLSSKLAFYFSFIAMYLILL